MSKVCEICGKHAVAGHSISHSHRVVNRKFRPNIQSVTVVVDGKKSKKNVCTRCLKKGNIARSF
jgi:large subunit ribosomal protein L28